MKKLLLTGVFALVPFVAFANTAPVALSALSAAGVTSTQETGAMVVVGPGKGMAVDGAVSGNYTTINTTGSASAGPGKATTKVTATQLNVGGTIAGGISAGDAKGIAGGHESSTDLGGSTADPSILLD
jgi:hypothetical protein